MAKGGLFAVVGPPEAEDEDDFSGDALPAEDDGDEPAEPMAGPFEAYCETVLNADAPYEERCEALRQAILTVIEERG